MGVNTLLVKRQVGMKGVKKRGLWLNFFFLSLGRKRKSRFPNRGFVDFSLLGSKKWWSKVEFQWESMTTPLSHLEEIEVVHSRRGFPTSISSSRGKLEIKSFSTSKQKSKSRRQTSLEKKKGGGYVNFFSIFFLFFSLFTVTFLPIRLLFGSSKKFGVVSLSQEDF